jgi:hypothetical protein
MNMPEEINIDMMGWKPMVEYDRVADVMDDKWILCIVRLFNDEGYEVCKCKKGNGFWIVDKALFLFDVGEILFWQPMPLIPDTRFLDTIPGQK